MVDIRFLLLARFLLRPIDPAAAISELSHIMHSSRIPQQVHTHPSPTRRQCFRTRMEHTPTVPLTYDRALHTALSRAILHRISHRTARKGRRYKQTLALMGSCLQHPSTDSRGIQIVPPSRRLPIRDSPTFLRSASLRPTLRQPHRRRPWLEKGDKRMPPIRA